MYFFTLTKIYYPYALFSCFISPNFFASFLISIAARRIRYAASENHTTYMIMLTKNGTFCCIVP